MAKHFGHEYAKKCFLADISSRFNTKKKQRYAEDKNGYIKEYLKKELDEVINAYALDAPTGNNQNTLGPIWIFWWDGIQTAPEIVQACVNSARRAAGEIPIIVLDKKNYVDYIALPEDICFKHDIGLIGHAHFSDMIRLSLLAQYGGLWVDATVYFAKPITTAVCAMPFFTCKMAEADAVKPSHDLWAGWILGGSKNCPLFGFARDALIYYWRKHDHVIDYLLMDYVFDIAYENIPVVNQLVDALEANNADRHQLMKCINQVYDPAFFERDTWCYKLSYRYGAPQKTTPSGHKTFYGHIINEGRANET